MGQILWAIFTSLTCVHSLMQTLLWLTFLQKMAAQARMKRTENTPTMKERMELSRKHHHFLKMILARLNSISAWQLVEMPKSSVFPTSSGGKYTWFSVYSCPARARNWGVWFFLFLGGFLASLEDMHCPLVIWSLQSQWSLSSQSSWVKMIISYCDVKGGASFMKPLWAIMLLMMILESGPRSDEKCQWEPFQISSSGGNAKLWLISKQIYHPFFLFLISQYLLFIAVCFRKISI